MEKKRLIFCFDGTWNSLDAVYPTNVVLTAETVLPLAPDGTAQVIFYDEGVGTDAWQTFRGGTFGRGLDQNIADGYRFLVFNYSPGDEIYVFGFSRGAYTARSFVGLISCSGILARKHAHKIGEAIRHYRNREDSDEFKSFIKCFRKDYAPETYPTEDELEWRKNTWGFCGEPKQLAIHYLGVWDTVGALGIPLQNPVAKYINRRHKFHDTNLSKFVKSARHAVAIDERRKNFEPTLWGNLPELHTELGLDWTKPDAPYQQMWFPGVHSAVGGGGERRGLSDAALEWVLDGARAVGLVLDGSEHSRVFETRPNYKEYIENSKDSGFMYRLMNKYLAADRLKRRPTALAEISSIAKRRWLEQAENLADKTLYRPRTLEKAREALASLNPDDFGLGGALKENVKFQLYEVKRGDTLTAIAESFYGKPDYKGIWQFNLDKIDNPDRIYPGQLIKIPR